MGVKLRQRIDKKTGKAKGWYVLTDWNGQRKAKFFGKDKKQAKAFADKLEARLKWAEQSGEPIVLSQPDQALPTVKAYLVDWLNTYAKVHCKPSTYHKPFFASRASLSSPSSTVSPGAYVRYHKPCLTSS